MSGQGEKLRPSGRGVVTEQEEKKLMMSRDELIARMKEGRESVSEALSPRDYLMACVDVMFGVAADVLADQWCDGTKGHEPTRKWVDVVTRCAVCGRLAAAAKYRGKKSSVDDEQR